MSGLTASQRAILAWHSVRRLISLSMTRLSRLTDNRSSRRSWWVVGVRWDGRRAVDLACPCRRSLNTCKCDVRQSGLPSRPAVLKLVFLRSMTQTQIVSHQNSTTALSPLQCSPVHSRSWTRNESIRDNWTPHVPRSCAHMHRPAHHRVVNTSACYSTSIWRRSSAETSYHAFAPCQRFFWLNISHCGWQHDRKCMTRRRATSFVNDVGKIRR